MRTKSYVLLLLFIEVFCFCASDRNQKQEEKETEAFLYYDIEQKGIEQTEDYKTIYVSASDYRVLTQEEDEYIQGLDGVVRTEYYGGAARTKYYYRFEKDYTFVEDLQIFQAVDREKEEHFMRSAGNLTQEDLEEGRLPREQDEIVLYTSDKSMLGKTIEMYFLCNDLCDDNIETHFVTGREASCVEKEMTITGILKEKTEQIYFEDSYCEMIGKMVTEFALKHIYAIFYETGQNNGIVSVKDRVGLDGSIRLEGGCDYEFLEWDGEYEDTLTLTDDNCRAEMRVIYADNRLENCEVSLSEIYMKHMDIMTREQYEDDSLSYGIYDIMEIDCRMPEDWQQEKNSWFQDEHSLIGYGLLRGVEMSYSEAKPRSYTVLQGIKDASSKSGEYTIAVSQELFDTIHPYEGSKVIAVYTEKGKEEEVKDELMKQGYVEYQLQIYK